MQRVRHCPSLLFITDGWYIDPFLYIVDEFKSFPRPLGAPPTAEEARLLHHQLEASHELLQTIRSRMLEPQAPVRDIPIHDMLKRNQSYPSFV